MAHSTIAAPTVWPRSSLATRTASSWARHEPRRDSPGRKLSWNVATRRAPDPSPGDQLPHEQEVRRIGVDRGKRLFVGGQIGGVFAARPKLVIRQQPENAGQIGAFGMAQAERPAVDVESQQRGPVTGV